MSAPICPQCGIRPRAPRMVGTRVSRWLLATCGDPQCIWEARRHAVIKVTGIHEFAPEQLKARGDRICPVCHGRRYFETVDGIAYEGCGSCGHTQRITPLSRPKGWLAEPAEDARRDNRGRFQPAKDSHPWKRGAPKRGEKRA